MHFLKKKNQFLNNLLNSIEFTFKSFIAKYVAELYNLGIIFGFHNFWNLFTILFSKFFKLFIWKSTVSEDFGKWYYIYYTGC